MMKHISGIFVLVISTFMLHAQNPTWSWAKNNGGGANDYSYGTATDTFGNVYYCGNFYSNNAKFGTTTIPSSGLGDGFLCKYDANGNFLWVKTFGGTDVETCKKVAVSPHGDVFVIGYSEGNFNVDSNAYSSYGEADCFVAKYTTDGKLKWCNHFGGPYDDYCYGLAVDSKGRCIVTGHFERTMTVGNVTLTSQNDSLYDGFIVKFDKSGNVLWATSAGGSIRGAYVFPNDVAIDASGNVFVTGLYSGPVNFGSTTFYSVDEAFISKLSNNGS